MEKPQRPKTCEVCDKVNAMSEVIKHEYPDGFKWHSTCECGVEYFYTGFKWEKRSKDGFHNQ